MFKPTNQNRELFVAGYDLHPSALRDLQRSWAHGFRAHIMPILLDHEHRFAHMYSGIGRGCWSVARQLGLMLLQQWFDLRDRELIDRLKFDLRFQYALELPAEHAYLARRSLYKMSARLVRHDPECKLLRDLFDTIAAAAIKHLELDVGNQRLDSTHITSNIRKHGQQGLFAEALRQLGAQLRTHLPDAFGQLDAQLRAWLDGDDDECWFGKGKPRTPLQQLAQWAVDTVQCFARHEQVAALDAYEVLAQVVSDYCMLAGPDDDGGGGGTPATDDAEPESDVSASSDEDGQAARVKVVSRGARGGFSIQSVHDVDAGYGHKGTGYQVQLTETCGNEEKPEIVTDFELQSAADSDWGKSTAVLLRLAALGLLPWRLFADAGYPTPEALLDAAQMGVELYAPVSRQAKHDGRQLAADEIVGRERFEFDAQGLVVRCPVGHAPIRHAVAIKPGSEGPELHAFFDGGTCRNCPLHGLCVARGKKHGAYWVRIEPRMTARDHAVLAQQEAQWWEPYSQRSGIEGTVSELKRGHGLGNLRVRGRLKMLMRTTLKVTACNIKRWLGAPDAAKPRSAEPPARGSHALRQPSPMRCASIALQTRPRRRSLRTPQLGQRVAPSIRLRSTSAADAA